MKNYVFDAGALSLLIAGDPRLRPYIDEISKNAAKAYISSVNLAEFYYKTLEKLGKEVAEAWFFRIVNSLIDVVPVDAYFAREAGFYKSIYKRVLSLADCFALALAVKTSSTLLTTDKDFEGIKAVKVKVLEV